MRNVCIFGLYRSGTNFLARLLKDNCPRIDVPNSGWFSDFIWKHAYNIENVQFTKEYLTVFNKVGNVHYTPQDRLRDLGVMNKAIYIHKHPYTWIESIIRRPLEIRQSYFEIDLGHFNTDEERETFGYGELNVLQLAKLNRAHASYWFNLMEQKKIARVQYEYLIQQPKKVFDNLVHVLSLPCSPKPQLSVPNKVPLSFPFTEASKQRYSKVQLERLTWPQIQQINDNLDYDVVRKQGYSLITTEDEYNSHFVGNQ